MHVSTHLSLAPLYIMFVDSSSSLICLKIILSQAECHSLAAKLNTAPTTHGWYRPGKALTRAACRQVIKAPVQLLH